MKASIWKGDDEFWTVEPRKLDAGCITDIGSRALAARLYCGVDVALVVALVGILEPVGRVHEA